MIEQQVNDAKDKLEGVKVRKKTLHSNSLAFHYFFREFFKKKPFHL
jgi:hypothetical protein